MKLKWAAGSGFVLVLGVALLLSRKYGVEPAGPDSVEPPDAGPGIESIPIVDAVPPSESDHTELETAPGEAIAPGPDRPGAEPAAGDERPREAPRRVERAVPASPVPKAVAAPWLSLIGHLTNDEGEPYLLFKDHRSGRLIRAGRNVDGWELIHESDSEFILESGGRRYLVRR